MGVAIITIFGRSYWRNNHLLIPLRRWDMAKKLGWNLLKVVPFLLQKTGRIFCPTAMTKNVIISGSTQPFFTEQGPLDSQLDSKSHQLITEVYSSGFKNGLESLYCRTTGACPHETTTPNSHMHQPSHIHLLHHSSPHALLHHSTTWTTASVLANAHTSHQTIPHSVSTAPQHQQSHIHPHAPTAPVAPRGPTAQQHQLSNKHQPHQLSNVHLLHHSNSSNACTYSITAQILHP